MAKMTFDRAIELLEIERMCVERADICDRDCGKCALLQDTQELLDMYTYVIFWIRKTKETREKVAQDFARRIAGLE